MTTYEQLRFEVELQTLITERYQMITANEAKKCQGEMIIYLESDFADLANCFADLETRIRATS